MRSTLGKACQGQTLQLIIGDDYCIEGIEMRQLGCKVRRLLFLNRY
jgi:hypothetical protein